VTSGDVLPLAEDDGEALRADLGAFGAAAGAGAGAAAVAAGGVTAGSSAGSGVLVASFICIGLPVAELASATTVGEPSVAGARATGSAGVLPV